MKKLVLAAIAATSFIANAEIQDFVYGESNERIVVMTYVDDFIDEVSHHSMILLGNKGAEIGALSFYCKGGEMGLFISTKEVLGGDYGKYKIRVDKGSVHSGMGSIGGDYSNNLYATLDSNAIIDEIAKGKLVTVYASGESDSYTETISLKGSSKLVSILKLRCKTLLGK